MNIYLGVGKKSYDLQRLTRKDRLLLQQRLRRDWNKYIREGKKFTFRQVPGLTSSQARIWSKAEQLLDTFGGKSEKAGIEAARQAKEAVLRGGMTLDLEQFKRWKQFSDGSLIIESEGTSNPVVSEKIIKIYIDKKLVFSAGFRSHCLSNPNCKVSVFKPGNWHKAIDAAWKNCWEKRRGDEAAMKMHWGTASLMVFSGK